MCVSAMTGFLLCLVLILACHVPDVGTPLLFCSAGQLFPDNDPTWKGASSDIFVKEAVRLGSCMPFQ
jgi:hypothetical protein